MKKHISSFDEPSHKGTISSFKEKFKNSEQTNPDITQDSFVVEICKEISEDVEKKNKHETASSVENL